MLPIRGYDRLLKSNTVKKRVHSLFRQGCMLFELIPNRPQARLLPLMQRFNEMLKEQGVFNWLHLNISIKNEGIPEQHHHELLVFS
jgi:hypothetical protein